MHIANICDGRGNRGSVRADYLLEGFVFGVGERFSEPSVATLGSRMLICCWSPLGTQLQPAMIIPPDLGS